MYSCIAGVEDCNMALVIYLPGSLSKRVVFPPVISQHSNMVNGRSLLFKSKMAVCPYPDEGYGFPSGKESPCCEYTGYLVGWRCVCPLPAVINPFLYQHRLNSHSK